ncbi:MAG: transketolase [Candidatus Thermofonsia Clade 1 bacterium]|uniref:Transketolase n=2 Tax=Candidatus Thermofonsia Clade 1 bacterium TaxID=2364210 RepID=A0A2M8PX56_9CHLR|nr:MAG: transketolase [Candidatus Thermofonsia Clade 1 bacterium]
MLETTTTSLETLAINTIRFLAVDAVQKANSGHPGLPLGAAPMAYTLWTRYLRHNPRNPKWPNRDRFILSAGHGSMLLYALLHLTGYDLSLEQIKNFRQWNSLTPGHPEFGLTPGVETTTGPLGQGFATAVGMAIAEAFLAATFNRPNYPIVDHYTYVLASDGDLMEGVASEAASLAGHLKLGKLIVLYDDNKVMLSNKTEVAFTEDVLLRFEAYGWHTQRVADGNDTIAIAQAIEAATLDPRPSLIAVRTIIGYGSPNKQGTHKAHGEPLGEEEVRLTKQALGWTAEEPFTIPGEVLEHFRTAVEHGERFEAEWNALFKAWAAEYPELAKLWQQAHAQALPEGWDADLPLYSAETKPMATRDANGAALNAIAKHLPTMIGGDADLSSSTKTLISGSGLFSATDRTARNLQFGVREHAMGAAINGLALHGGIRKPYTATFMTFSDYMRPAIRLAALMEIDPIFVFTHDSIGVGEDGPTHQPIEHLAALRAIPHLTVIRPADANETSAAWRVAMLNKRPTVLVFTRQKLPVYAPDGVLEGVARGAYIKAEAVGGAPEVILIATGSEVSLIMAAHQTLNGMGIRARAVSMPSFELFEAQDAAYKEHVLPSAVTARVAIEAAVPFGWHRYVGAHGKIIALERFGASAPQEVVFRELGLTAEAVVAAARELLGR